MQNELEHLYGALIKAVISYSSPVWGGAAKSDLENIDRLQKSAVKMGIIRNYDPVSEIMKEADVALKWVEKTKFTDTFHKDQHMLQLTSERECRVLLKRD